VATEWPEFADLEPGRIAGSMKGRVIVDARNILDADAIRGAGLDYRGMGR
jgi:UDPglucose 6-dehydrogenase